MGMANQFLCNFSAWNEDRFLTLDPPLALEDICLYIFY
jgi:hypothetical protein